MVENRDSPPDSRGMIFSSGRHLGRTRWALLAHLDPDGLDDVHVVLGRLSVPRLKELQRIPAALDQSEHRVTGDLGVGAVLGGVVEIQPVQIGGTGAGPHNRHGENSLESTGTNVVLLGTGIGGSTIR